MEQKLYDIKPLIDAMGKYQNSPTDFIKKFLFKQHSDLIPYLKPRMMRITTGKRAGRNKSWAVNEDAWFFMKHHLRIDCEDLVVSDDWFVADSDYGAKKNVEGFKGKRDKKTGNGHSIIKKGTPDVVGRDLGLGLDNDSGVQLCMPRADDRQIEKEPNFTAITPRGDRVNARELHRFLQVETPFSHWASRRIEQYGFVRSVEWFDKNDQSNSPEYFTIETAKQLCMVEKTEIGKKARLYFLECERKVKVTDSGKSHLDFLVEAVQALRDQSRQISELKADLPNTINKVIAEKADHGTMPDHLVGQRELAKRMGDAVNVIVLRDSYQFIGHPEGQWTYTDVSGDARFPLSFERDGLGELESRWINEVLIERATDRNYICRHPWYHNGQKSFYIKRDKADNDQKVWGSVITRFKKNIIGLKTAGE